MCSLWVMNLCGQFLWLHGDKNPKQCGAAGLGRQNIARRATTQLPSAAFPPIQPHTSAPHFLVPKKEMGGGPTRTAAVTSREESRAPQHLGRPNHPLDCNARMLPSCICQTYNVAHGPLSFASLSSLIGSIRSSHRTRISLSLSLCIDSSCLSHDSVFFSTCSSTCSSAPDGPRFLSLIESRLLSCIGASHLHRNHSSLTTCISTTPHAPSPKRHNLRGDGPFSHSNDDAKNSPLASSPTSRHAPPS
jgi:hypothetical protein